MTGAAETIRTARAKIDTFDPSELRAAGLIPLDGSYYPAIYYPPIPMYPKVGAEELLKDFAYDPCRPFSVYLHVPFCASRCTYCHWVVNVGSSEEDRDRYVASLSREMALYKAMLGMRTAAPSSVLVGGGTPSMLSAVQLDRLLAAFEASFELSRCTQMTCEVEPTTVLGASGLEKLRAMRAHGVRRISLGVQSFSDKALRDMGRHHRSSEALEAVDQIRRAGFESLSLDLIYGYPGCTPEEWLATLEQAFSLDIDACQLYRLRIVPHGEKVGAIKGRFDAAPAGFPSVDDIYVMKELGILSSAERGLREVSRRVFAKGPEHNSAYLTDHTDGLGDVFGLGISSWSNLQGRFFVNTGESLDTYHRCVAAGRLPIAKGRVRTLDDERRWAVAVPLKHHGVSKEKYRELTGEGLEGAFGRKIESLKKFGLLWEDSERLGLTERGAFFADEVVIQFYHPEHMPFPEGSYADGELNPYRG